MIECWAQWYHNHEDILYPQRDGYKQQNYDINWYMLYLWCSQYECVLKKCGWFHPELGCMFMETFWRWQRKQALHTMASGLLGFLDMPEKQWFTLTGGGDTWRPRHESLQSATGAK